MSELDDNADSLTLQEELTCLHCWSRCPPDEVLWISEHQELLGDPLLGESAQRRFLPARFTLTGEALDPRGQVCREIACPHCHLPLPRAMLEHQPLLVSIIGTPTCGKSYYLGALTWSLRRMLPKLFGVEFVDVDPAANRMLHIYEEKLFLSQTPDQLIALGALINKTPVYGGGLLSEVNFGQQKVQYAKPFSFVVQPTERHPRAEQRSRLARVCCLYDNAGEHFLPGNDTLSNQSTRHLAMSSLLLFLYDPTQDPRLNDVLRRANPDRQPPPTESAGRQETVLREVAQRIRTQLSLGREAKVDRPLFIAVTKADLWASVLGEFWSEEPWTPIGENGLHAIDIPSILRMSEKTRQLLERFVPELVAAAHSLSTQVYFLPVSATGVRPEWDSEGKGWVRPKDLVPVWVSVPFAHALSHTVSGLLPRLKPT